MSQLWKNIHWPNAAFLILGPAFCAVAVPLELARVGFQPEVWLIALGMYAATGLSVCAGYHRLFAHRTYEAKPWVKALYLLFASGSLQNSAISWSADHRQHHGFTDTKDDPYNIKQGFFYAHMGWVMLREHEGQKPQPPKDLWQDPLVTFQHRYYVPLMLAVGFGLPTLLGWLWVGNAWGGLLIGGLLRVVIVHHFVFSVNSAAHYFGNRPYSDKTSARDSWWVALVSFGEGYHNFHHTFEYDYRNGIRWYQWDPNKWLIYLLSLGGHTWALKRASAKTIALAQIKMAESVLASRGLEVSRLAELRSRVEAAHDRFRAILEDYRKSRVRTPKAEVRAARREIRDAWQEWKRTVRALAPAPAGASST